MRDGHSGCLSISNFAMFYSLPQYFRGKNYRFRVLFGLLCSDRKKHLERSTPDNEKLMGALNLVDNPFLVYKIKSRTQSSSSSLIRFYAKFLIWCHRHFYPLLILFSYFRFNIYPSAVDACDVFAGVAPMNQHVLCFPRSIFAATTSKRFKRNGTLFIGVFLPSHKMHAWIIEDGANSYRQDTIWTNYTPISAMV